MSLLRCACSSSQLNGQSLEGPYMATQDVEKQEESTEERPMQDTYMSNAADYKLHTIIGKGCGCGESATIWLAKYLPSSTIVAIKMIHLEKCSLDVSMIRHEVQMQRLLQHTNMLPILSTFVHNNDIWIIMPVTGFGSCKDLIHAHFTEGLPEMAIAYILRDVLVALEYIHHRNAIHRSIRASHILVSSTGGVFLTGLRHCYSMLQNGTRARAVFDFPDHYLQSLRWASPELLRQDLGGYDTKSDIYSIGITACELANGIVPFADIPVTEMLLEKLEDIKPRLLDCNTIPELQMPESTATDSGVESGTASSFVQSSPYQRSFSASFHQFVELCLNCDPRQRPSASALSQHPFLKQVKRKSGINTLPELLLPVTPITDLDSLQIDSDEPVENLIEKLDNVDMEEDIEWEF